MLDPETTWIPGALSRWLHVSENALACPVDIDPERLGDVLERNRLLPMFRQMAIIWPSASGWQEFQSRLDSAYQHSLLQGLQQLRTGHHVMECLSLYGIKSVAVRGPFLAEDVYDDPAARMSADIDILVSCGDRRRAWKACKAAGYRSLDWECPLWPFDKHRIHWRLQRKGDPVVCELHWAVEPVYGATTLDYEALVNDPIPTRQFLLLCLHAGEHVLERFSGTVRRRSPQAPSPTLEEAMEQGMLFRWLDVAMFMRKYAAQLDWAEIERHARDRRVSASLALCLRGVRDWFNMPLPERVWGLLVKWEDATVLGPATGIRCRLEEWWERRACRAVGLKTSLGDVMYYLWPQAPFFEPVRGLPLALKRVGHVFKAGSVLLAALMSYTCFVLITGLRRPLRQLLAGWALLVALTGSVHAHEFNDDCGDTPATAKSIMMGSNLVGCIEIDVDQDWYYFQSSYSTNKEIVVTVTTGTLWNSTAGLAAPDGVVTLVSTDSVSSVTSRVTWIHIGPPATYFVQVSGFASFTTGTYTIAVNELPFDDKDYDGMPDSWEIAYFGNTNQPASGVSGDYDNDGSFNIDEFRAGTHPTNQNSRLRVTGFIATNGPSSVSWAAAPYRYYDVEVSTNLMGGGWNYLGTVTNLNALGTLRYDDPTVPVPPIRFYRVRCL